MKDIKLRITDIDDLTNGYVLREGFTFTSLTNPANVFDAIVINHPFYATSFSPCFPTGTHSIDECVDFINKHKIEKAVIVAERIDFIARCPSLVHLMIVPADTAGANFDFSPIYQLQNLKSLVCQTVYGPNFCYQTTIDYSCIKGLWCLNMAEKGHLNSASLSELKSCRISNSDANDLSALLGSKALKCIRIVNSNIVSLDGIEASNSIQYADFSSNRRLADITALERVKPTLRYLSIENCARIKDFSVLEKLENLEGLMLYGSNKLPDLKFLENLPNLQVFGFDMEVLDGDMTPCLRLKRAYCAKSKKHYNLTNKDLPKGDVSTDLGYDGIEEWCRF